MDYYDLLQEQDNQCALADRSNHFRTNNIQQKTNGMSVRTQKIGNKLKPLTRKRDNLKAKKTKYNRTGGNK